MTSPQNSPASNRGNLQLGAAIVAYLGIAGLLFWAGYAATPPRLRDRPAPGWAIAVAVTIALLACGASYRLARRHYAEHPRHFHVFNCTFPLLCLAVAALLTHWLGTGVFILAVVIGQFSSTGLNLVRWGNPFSSRTMGSVNGPER